MQVDQITQQLQQTQLTTTPTASETMAKETRMLDLGMYIIILVLAYTYSINQQIIQLTVRLH